MAYKKGRAAGRPFLHYTDRVEAGLSVGWQEWSVREYLSEGQERCGDAGRMQNAKQPAAVGANKHPAAYLLICCMHDVMLGLEGVLL
jgi:hypothetical protein